MPTGEATAMFGPSVCYMLLVGKVFISFSYQVRSLRFALLSTFTGSAPANLYPGTRPPLNEGWYPPSGIENWTSHGEDPLSLLCFRPLVHTVYRKGE